MPKGRNPKRLEQCERSKKPTNSSPKGLETNKNGPGKMCMGIEKGRQEKPRNKKRQEGQVEKPQVKNPKRVK